jgi:hypothetical protein
MIRGGVEYNLGIFITGVDKDSVADRAGLMVSMCFLNKRMRHRAKLELRGGGSISAAIRVIPECSQESCMILLFAR